MFTSFIFILMMMFAVINIELMVLHALRIKWTADDREALYRISGYSSSARAVVVFTLIMVVIFWYPPILGAVEEQMVVGDPQPGIVDTGVYDFTSGDPFNLTYAKEIKVKTTNGVRIIVVLMEEKAYEDNPDALAPNISYTPRPTTQFQYNHRLDYGEYSLVAVNTDSVNDADVEYEIQKRVDRNFINTFVFFMWALFIANILWSVYLWHAKHGVIRRYIKKEQSKLEKSFTVEDVFLIYKDGRLIAHNTRRLKPDVDKDILTGMLTAVQNFVKESFQKDEAGVLDEMHYGNLRILIENGPYANMAVVVSGEEPRDMRDKMRRILKDIHHMYGDYLGRWDGDTTALEECKKIIGEITPAPKTEYQNFVEELFLIHRDGRFISHATHRLGPDVDDLLLIDTLDYIKEQVGPSQNAVPSSLPRRLPYGDWNIAVEYAADVYMAALLSGPEPRLLRDVMIKNLEEVTMRYGEVLYQWDGKMDHLTDLKKVIDSVIIQIRLRGKKGRG
jgi:hypothetical protein